MAVDKLVDSTQLDADLTAVADAIRTKGGTSAQLAFPAEFVSAITAIPAGGGVGITVRSGTVKLQNNRGSQFVCVRIKYDAYSNNSSGFGAYNSNVSNGSTLNEARWAIFSDTDGDYIVFHSNTSTWNFTYNDEPVAYVSYGSGGQWDIHVYLPTGFDDSIPIVVGTV